jgi:hypothetical protein
MTFKPGTAVLKTCIDMAQRGFDEEDFKRFALMSYRFGEQNQDLVTTLQFLKDMEVIDVLDGKLRLLGIKDPNRFTEQITTGDTLAWDVFDNVPVKYRKFNPDQAAQSLLGAQGELAVIKELKKSMAPDLQDKIIHVSLLSDHFGYDIESPSRFEDRGQLALEVKTTSRPGDILKFFLSRNEYRAGLEHDHWNLVFVQLLNSSFNVVGHLPHLEIKARVPKNTDRHFIWESISGTIHKNEIFPGLPE